MIRILIVEDEKIFREYITNLLDWSAYNMEVAASVKNGMEALQVMEKEQIDIALVDICMPIMDGLSFSKKAKEVYPSLKILLLTGHNEFEYAQTAVKLGISDYILKPFDEEEVLHALLPVQQMIEEERSKSKYYNRQKRDFLIEYMNYLISDSYVKKLGEYREFLVELKEGKEVSSYCIAVIEEDYFDDSWKCQGQNTLWRKTVLNMLEEVFSGRERVFCFCNENGKIMVVLLLEKAEQAYHDKLEMVCRIVRTKLRFSITCALSEPFFDLMEMRRQYDELQKILNQKFICGYGSVLRQGEEQIQVRGDFYPKIPVDRIRTSFLAGDYQYIEESLEQLMKEMETGKMSLEMIHLVYSELISTCLSVISERGEDISAIYGEHFMPFTQIHKGFHIEAAMHYIQDIYKKGITYLSKVNYSRTRIIAGDAKEFIKKNYADTSLSVESVAAHLFINSSYLRSAFKKETSITVSGYIFKVRMEKAHELIPRVNIKLIDIASMVGFNDGAYFSKCFKKQYGLSPSEYAHVQKRM